MHRDAVPEALSQKDAGWNSVAGVSCYPIAFLSNKVAYFPEEKLTPSPMEFWVTVCDPEFFCFKWH
jgi:hypothetical protein